MKVLNTHHLDQEVLQRVKVSPSLLMLDYDGTLAPFSVKRMEAFPYPGVIDRLKSLTELKNVRVVIVSGRSLKDLDTLLGSPSRLELWGSHGLERQKPDGKRIYAELGPLIQAGLADGLAICKSLHPEEDCEIKPFAVALHWRGKDTQKIASQIEATTKRWEEVCKNHPLEIHAFNGGIELRPKGKGKGDVVRHLLAESPQVKGIAYIGDDATDEEAFITLGEKGLKILISDTARPTKADMILSAPEELLQFLDRWIHAASEG